MSLIIEIGICSGMVINAVDLLWLLNSLLLSDVMFGRGIMSSSSKRSEDVDPDFRRPKVDMGRLVWSNLPPKAEALPLSRRRAPSHHVKLPGYSDADSAFLKAMRGSDADSIFLQATRGEFAHSRSRPTPKHPSTTAFSLAAIVSSDKKLRLEKNGL